MDRVTVNAWSRLEYVDPEGILRALREVEDHTAHLIADPRVRALRTHGLKSEREARDAAIFSYGMGQAVLRTKVLFAPVEESDHDFITTWEAAGVRHYCPVQLKEFVPAALNASQKIEDLMRGLRKYTPSEHTVVAIKLNRRFHLGPIHAGRTQSKARRALALRRHST